MLVANCDGQHTSFSINMRYYTLKCLIYAHYLARYYHTLPTYRSETFEIRSKFLAMVRQAFLTLVAAACVLQYVASFRMLGGHRSISMRNHQALYKSPRTKEPSWDTKPPMKVLLLVEPTPFNYISGYANRFKEMLGYMKQAGDEVRVVTPDADAHPPTEFLGYPITSPKGFALPVYKKVTLTFDFMGAIPKLIRSFRPNVVHVSSPSCILFPAIFWARWFEVPLVLSYHTDLVAYAKAYFPYFKNTASSVCQWLVKRCHSFADLTLCTSPQLRWEMQRIGVRRVDVWQKGINTEVFHPKHRNDTTREELSNGHPDAPLLLYVGRLGVEKKLDRLRPVLERNPKARLVVVGEGPAEAALRETLSVLPVHFTGKLEGEALSRAYASCDIFVMPSDTETLGLVAMEALASGLPVVAVRAGGLVDIVEHEKTGFLAENDPKMVDFSARVGKLIRGARLRLRMGTAAVNWARTWSWRAATQKLRNWQYPAAIELHRSRDEAGRHHVFKERVIQHKYL